MLFQQLLRWTAALVFAALAPTFVMAVLDRSVKLAPFAFGITLAHAIVLGLPLFLFFRSKRWVNAISSTGVGFIVGAVPGAVLAFPLRPDIHLSASQNGIATVIDGIPTAAGWFYYVESLVFLGALGALAGFIFWLVLKYSGDLGITAEVAADRSGPSTRWNTTARRGEGLAVVAILLAGTVLSIPAITKDRTCHNMFRDGRTSVGPQANIELQVGIPEWPKLTKILADFAVAHELSFRNSSRSASSAKILFLSLCNEQGVSINVMDQRWVSHDFEPLIPGRGAAIPIYQLREGSRWKDFTGDLVAELESAWPGKIQFRDGRGRIIPMPKELQGAGVRTGRPE